MTLDEAIKHARHVAEAVCAGCAEEQIQLAEWLEDYKRLKELEKGKSNSIIVEKLRKLSKDYCEKWSLDDERLELDEIIDLIREEVLQSDA